MNLHTLSFGKMTPQNVTSYGSRTWATKANFPALQGMSLYHLVIEERCFREPHWHPNADELGYCMEGSALVTIFSHGNQHDRFSIKQGDMFLIPSGALHSIENIGQGRCEMILNFSNDTPEDFGLSGAVGCMSLEVMGNTWGQNASSLKNLTRSQDDIIFGKRSEQLALPDSADFPNRLKFSVEAAAKIINTDYGFAKLARKDTWPALRSQAMYSLHLYGTGMREPHWHPETAELGYLKKGRARMTIKSPGRNAETFLLEPGDAYFIPKAYPHHIENLTDEEIHFLIFFDTPIVQDIGYTGAIPAFPHSIIGPTLKLDATQISIIPEIPTDKLIIKKINKLS